MDLNQFHFDHETTLVRADDAATPEAHRNNDANAPQIAGRLGIRQVRLGAAAACAWMANARRVAA